MIGGVISTESHISYASDLAILASWLIMAYGTILLRYIICRIAAGKVIPCTVAIHLMVAEWTSIGLIVRATCLDEPGLAFGVLWSTWISCIRESRVSILSYIVIEVIIDQIGFLLKLRTLLVFLIVGMLILLVVLLLTVTPGSRLNHLWKHCLLLLTMLLQGWQLCLHHLLGLFVVLTGSILSRLIRTHDQSLVSWLYNTKDSLPLHDSLRI